MIVVEIWRMIRPLFQFQRVVKDVVNDMDKTGKRVQSTAFMAAQVRCLNLDRQDLCL